MSVCCPCDVLVHPQKPDIPAGLPALPRQLAGLPEYRRAMLRDIALQVPLSGWRARGGDDSGIMLLEMWAYVLDILAFYDERIANETYLRTAIRSASMRKLVRGIGYQPRPALAASVVLAAIADGNRSVLLPAGTGFRSDAFDGERPQIFETEFEHSVHPLKNEWQLDVVRENVPGDELLLDPATAALDRGQLTLYRWTSASTAQRQLHAGRVTRIESIEGLDGANYLRVELDQAPILDPLTELSAVQVLSPTLSAVPNTFHNAPVSRTRTSIILDAVYSQFARQDPVIVRCGHDLHPATITAVESENVELTPAMGDVPATTSPATQITFTPPLPSHWACDPRHLAVHFNMIESGQLTRISKIHLTEADFFRPGMPIEGTVEPMPEGVSKPGELLLHDANDNGLLAGGSVKIDGKGRGLVHLSSDTPRFDPELRTPVIVFGNLVRATRGESVFNEVLGSGDASQAFQSFTVRNKPLTYLNDPSAPNGRRSTLEVRVNGIEWEETSSFFGAGPQDQVYVVRQNDEQESIVTGGDGRTGARFPTGIDNVTATYRFGAGAAKPPAGAIAQLARPVEGLRRVVNPVAAGGGADADQPKDIRRNAPNSALLLGRAVSIPDFKALAREFGGVINAHVEWAWDETRQGAVVKVCFVSDGGDIARELRAFLLGQADPNTPLTAVPAVAVISELSVDLEVDPRHNSDIVVAEVKETLVNPGNGILALQNIPIGQPLFRSRIFEAILTVEGTRSVRNMSVDGQPAPFAIIAAQGQYLNFLQGLSIKASGG